MKELNNLSKEELLALLNKQDKKLSKLQKQLSSKESEFLNVQNKLSNTQDKLLNTENKLLNTQNKLSTINNKLSDTKKELDEANKEKEKANKELIEANKEIETLRVNNRLLNEKINELIKKYEEKTELNKKILVDTYVPKNEKLDSVVINELEETTNKKKDRKTPYKSIIEDLKKIGVDNTITLDYDFKTNNVDKGKVKSFGKDECYKIEVEPVNIKVNKIERLKYKDKDNIYETLSDDIFPHSPLTPSLAAHIINVKYVLGVPFYRYSNYLNTLNINVSDVDICNWASKTINLIEPVYEKILNKLVMSDIKVIHIDETTLSVIDSDKSKCYMFAYASSIWDTPLIAYDFNENRTIDHTENILKGYKGYIVTDGYQSYNKLTNNGIIIQRCLTHARRKFMDVLKTLNENERKASPAYKIVETIGKLYKQEEKFKDKKYTPSRIKEERNKPYYLEIINKLDDLINKQKDSADGLLKIAINYYLNQRKELFTYLDYGYLPLDNNRIERDAIKAFVINRKNFLFCKSADGAINTAKIFTIVQTARANGLKVEPYLKYLISNINKEPLDKLLPWSNNLPNEIKIASKDI